MIVTDKAQSPEPSCLGYCFIFAKRHHTKATYRRIHLIGDLLVVSEGESMTILMYKVGSGGG